MDFVDVNESNARWVQDFRLKAYSSPAKLESIDGERLSPHGLGWGSQRVCGPPAAPHSAPGAPWGMPPGAVIAQVTSVVRPGPRVRELHRCGAGRGGGGSTQRRGS